MSRNETVREGSVIIWMAGHSIGLVDRPESGGKDSEAGVGVAVQREPRLSCLWRVQPDGAAFVEESSAAGSLRVLRRTRPD